MGAGAHTPLPSTPAKEPNKITLTQNIQYNELIANVYIIQPAILLIAIKIGMQMVPFLVYTGRSVLLFSKDLFIKNKSNIIYKNLSHKVEILQ